MDSMVRSSINRRSANSPFEGSAQRLNHEKAVSYESLQSCSQPFLLTRYTATPRARCQYPVTPVEVVNGPVVDSLLGVVRHCKQFLYHQPRLTNHSYLAQGATNMTKDLSKKAIVLIFCVSVDLVPGQSNIFYTKRSYPLCCDILNTQLKRPKKGFSLNPRSCFTTLTFVPNISRVLKDIIRRSGIAQHALRSLRRNLQFAFRATLAGSTWSSPCTSPEIYDHPSSHRYSSLFAASGFCSWLVLCIHLSTATYVERV